MPRYRRRPKIEEQAPGLFDAFELDLSRDEELPIHPSIAKAAKLGRLGGPAFDGHNPDGQSLGGPAFDGHNPDGQSGTSGCPQPDLADDITPMAAPNVAGRLRFISFGSGSSGNSAYIGDDSCGLLIDAGIDPLKIEKELMRHRIDLKQIKGILLTHDHSDHVRYAYTALRKFRSAQLYCTPRVLSGILRRHNISRRIKDYHHPIYKEHEVAIGPFRVTAFEVDHDGSDNAGFFISIGEHTMAIATDLGVVGERADFYMRQARYLMIESNYDLDMLRHGRYPEYLKARIIASNGHLDNSDAAAYVASIYRPELTHVFLCHLSHDNNTPEKAFDAMAGALRALGVTVGDGSDSIESRDAAIQVVTLPRFDPTRLFI
ncbi:MAG: MBL fold metallo-hydrolase, partial [Bacteroidales bacterium]|nr:MBL fold metallo-hydrolase [Bacteroidales bacterium]